MATIGEGRLNRWGNDTRRPCGPVAFLCTGWGSCGPGVIGGEISMTSECIPWRETCVNGREIEQKTPVGRFLTKNRRKTVKAFAKWLRRFGG